MVHNIPCTISFFWSVYIYIYIYIISLAIENEPWMILKTLFMNHEPLVDAEISDFRGKVADSNSRAARAAGSCRDVTTDRQVSPGWRTQMELGKAEDCVSHTLFSLDYIYIYTYCIYIYIYTVYIYICYCSNLFMVQDFADFHLTLQQIFLWHSDRGFGISQVIPNLGWVVAQSFSFLLYMEHHHNQQWVVVFVDYQRLTTFKRKMQCTYIYIL